MIHLFFTVCLLLLAYCGARTLWDGLSTRTKVGMALWTLLLLALALVALVGFIVLPMVIAYAHQGFRGAL